MQTTRLDVHWDGAAFAWVFTATRDNLVWQWTVDVEEFRLMAEAMQNMVDELDCAAGARLRNNINREDD